MASVEDQKLKLANRMAQGSQPKSTVDSEMQANYGLFSPEQRQELGFNGSADPMRVQAGQYRKDFSRESAAHMGNVNLRDWGYTGDSYNVDKAGYDKAYNNWLYNSNDVLANAMTTESQKQQYRLDQEAEKYASDLNKMKSDSNNLIAAEADQALGQGLHNVRKGANDRGLLYSGIREGDESSLRGRVSSLMAKQISESNADLDQGLQSRKQSAAAAKLNDASAALERQAQLDSVRQANSIARGQQMQQLATMAGYAAGSLSSKEKQPPNTSNPEG